MIKMDSELVELRFALEESMEQFVMMNGTILMRLWYVNSWDSLLTVTTNSVTVHNYSIGGECVVEHTIGAIAWSGDEIRFSEGVLPSVMGMVNCSGDELRIIDCHHAASPPCGRFSDAGVFCQGE